MSASSPTTCSKGRGTGQRGGDIAAEYIATQFALDGLKPAGDNGTYMQKVPMVGITLAPGTTFSLVPAKGRARELKLLSEYVAQDQTQQPDSTVNAEIVYVGYGIEAPEYQWDDYKGVDVKGKVLLMLVNEPTSDDPKFLQGQGAHLLRTLDLQIRRSRAQRRGGRDPDSSDRDGQLSLGSGAQLKFGREVLSAVGRFAETESRLLDSP